MTRLRDRKLLIISLIGTILTVFAGLSGDIVLKAESPAHSTKSDFNFNESLHTLDADLQAGKLTKITYDSLYLQLHAQMKRRETLQADNHIPDKMPQWVRDLGMPVPENMVYEPVFSEFTTQEYPSEGFNSVNLVYTGNYEEAVKQAAKIAEACHLSKAGNFIAKGSPMVTETQEGSRPVSYLNYSLTHCDQDFLISVQVKPTGRMSISVTDNKQLTACLIASKPSNYRLNHQAKKKKM